jgi:hypothetical protein
MITPSYSLTATERVLPRLALDFTTAALDSRITFTRSGNTATVTDATGVIVGINADLPRFDFNPSTLACQGLLIEEARTNLLLNSLIDGTSLATQTVTVTAAAHTLSFYGTGDVVLSGVASATVSGTGAYPSRKTYTFTPTAGSLTLTVTGTVQFANLELGAFATSFIPTDGTTKTRNVDVATITGANFTNFWNNSEGAFSIFWTQYFLKTTGFPFVFEAQGSLRSPQTTNGVRYYGQTSGNTFALSGVTTTSQNGVCVAYKTNENEIISSKGSAILTNNAAFTGAAPTQFSIGCDAAGTNQISGHFQKVLYWPQKLTNAELQAFSKG